MICTAELLIRIQKAIESLDYGTITVVVNTKGDYTEVRVEQKERIDKHELGYHKG